MPSSLFHRFQYNYLSHLAGFSFRNEMMSNLVHDYGKMLLPMMIIIMIVIALDDEKEEILYTVLILNLHDEN
jgi:hypothetical protein